MLPTPAVAALDTAAVRRPLVCFSISKFEEDSKTIVCVCNSPSEKVMQENNRPCHFQLLCRQAAEESVQ